MLELVDVLEHVGQVLEVGRAARQVEHALMLLPDGHCASLGVDGREVVGKGVDAVERALLERVLPDLVVLAVLLLLDGELLHCGEVAVLLVLLADLPLRRLPALALLAVAEHLLLKGRKVDLLQALRNLLFLLLLGLPASGLKIDEVEISRVLTRQCFRNARRRVMFLARRRRSHFLLFSLYLL